MTQTINISDRAVSAPGTRSGRPFSRNVAKGVRFRLAARAAKRLGQSQINVTLNGRNWTVKA
jgi:hypothetical protein